MRIGMLLSALLSVLVVADISAQAMSSRTVARALPRNEMSIGIEQWQYTPDSTDTAEGWTRWGFMLNSRGSLFGQWNLSETDGEFLIGDYIDLGVGFYGATGIGSSRQPPVMRIPVQLGAQLGKLTETGTQLVGRAGFAVGLDARSYGGPFLGARVKRRRLGLESTYIGADRSDLISALLRWYPRAGPTGFNVALRYEYQRYRRSDFLDSDQPSRERSLTLVFSGER